MANVVPVALGQLLALLIAIAAATSTSLAQQKISLPTLQSALNYVCLAVVYSCIHKRFINAAGGNRKWASHPWWKYALLALMDVEANFLLVTSYRYTSITSVTLLDCFSIPLAVLLTRVFLKSVYNRGHYFGAAICIAGLCLLVVSDQQTSSDDTPELIIENADIISSALFGDLLVIIGASMYAVCNVYQEYLLDDVPVSELLSMLGIFGSIISLVQSIPLELHNALAVDWSNASILSFWLFGIALFMFYSLVPYELQLGGAAILNLSLLSSDVWTALARLLFFGGFNLMSGISFLVSFLVVTAGIALYVASGDVKTHQEVADSISYQPVQPDGGLEAGESPVGARSSFERAKKVVELGSSPSFSV